MSTTWGDCVLLDMRHLGEKKINERLPFVRDLSISYLGVDPVKDPVPIRPVVHYMMGGIHTDINAATPMPGLYAAGECACVSINGANRLGSNSLTELLVFGRRAATLRIAYMQSGAPAAKESAMTAKADAAQGRIRALFQKSNGTESISGLRKEMTSTMEADAGIYRTQRRAGRSCQEDRRTARRATPASNCTTRPTSTTPTCCRRSNSASMLDCAEAVAVGALARTESRGAHQRLDFTERDDTNFLRHTLAYYQPKEPPRIDYLDVVITKSKPGVRDYSGAKK